MIQLSNVQKPQEEFQWETHEPHFIAVYDHDPVLDEVGDEAELFDHAHDPVDGWIDGWVVVYVGRHAKFFLVFHDLKSNVDYRAKLAIFAEGEEKGRVL
jgi:hypothetical protein